jgi:hypothetical protein
MLALQEMDDWGDAAELVNLLEENAQDSQRGAFWSEPDSDFRVVNSPEYVTAMVYLAISSYDQSEYRELARNWLVDNSVNMYGNSQDAVGIFYALTVANIDNVEGRKGANKVNLVVNGQQVRNFNVGGDKDWIGNVKLSVDSRYLREGENSIIIERSGRGQLYVVSTLKYYTEELDQESEFNINRSIKDFYSGRELNSVSRGQVVVIRDEVRIDRAGYNLIVKDYISSGFIPVQYELGAYDYDLISKWWNWGRSDGVSRYGEVTSNHVTFSKYEVKKDNTYVFEYPAIAAFTGKFSGGGAQAYFQNFEDVNGFIYSGEVEVVR